jgi:hypothetical protein
MSILQVRAEDAVELTLGVMTRLMRQHGNFCLNVAVEWVEKDGQPFCIMVLVDQFGHVIPGVVLHDQTLCTNISHKRGVQMNCIVRNGMSFVMHRHRATVDVHGRLCLGPEIGRSSIRLP